MTFNVIYTNNSTTRLKFARYESAKEHYNYRYIQLPTGEFYVIAEHTSLKLPHATGSVAVPDRQYLSGMLYKEFDLFLLSNCTFSGPFRMDAR